MRNLRSDHRPSRLESSSESLSSSHRHARSQSHTLATTATPPRDLADDMAAVASRPRSALDLFSHRPFSRKRDEQDALSLVRKHVDDSDDDSLGLVSPRRRRRASVASPLALVPSSNSPSNSPPNSPPLKSPSLNSPSYTHTPPQISISHAEAWVTGDLPNTTDPATAAYKRAQQALQTELGPADAKWVRDVHTIEDVEGALSGALAAWKGKGGDSKVVVWLRAASSRILHYGSIFEIVSQHHPEYVSFAYGAFKFLFVIVMQHEELCVEISKAVARIADVLPRMSLRSALFRTEHMVSAVAAVYAKIIEFAVLAIRWCRRGRVMQGLQAITKPWTIGYKAIVDEIVELSRRVDDVAAAASQAEIRMLTSKNEELHKKVDSLEVNIHRLTEVLVSQHSLHQQIHIDLREHKSLFRQEQIFDIREAFVLPSDPVPDTCLAYVRSLRNRRRQKTPTSLPPPQLRKLKEFMASPISAIMLAQGHGVRTSSLDFAADFVDIVLENKIAVLWALPDKAPLSKSPSRYDDDSDSSDSSDDSDDSDHHKRQRTIMGILRSMVVQALGLESGLVSDGKSPIDRRHLRAADTVKKWFDLLQRCILAFPRLLIVIDLSVVEAAVANSEDPFSVDDFVSALEAMLDHLPPRRPLVKVVVVSWRFGAVHRLARGTASFVDDRYSIYTDRGPRQERLARRPKYRALAKRRGERMPERFREIVDAFEMREGDVSEESESDDDDEACGRYGSWNT